MFIPRTTALLIIIACALSAQSLTQEGRIGSRVSLRYPESWTFSAGPESGVLQSPPNEPDPQFLESNKSTPGGSVSLQLHYTAAVRHQGEPAEVAAAFFGSAAGARATRPEQTTLGEQGGWIHTLHSPSGGRMRVYALALRNGGTVLATVSGPDRLLASARPTLEAVLRTLRSVDPSAKDAPAAENTPAPEPPPAPRPPARVLPPEQEAKLIQDWQTTLAGHTWTAGRKHWNLAANGQYEFDSVILIAGLDDSAGRRTTDRGQWRITIRDAEPWLELRPERGEPIFIACARSGEAILIDGEPAGRQ